MDQTWFTVLYAKDQRREPGELQYIVFRGNFAYVIVYLLFLISPKLMKVSEVVTAMRASRLPEMAHRRRFLCEGPPLLGWLGIMPRRKRMCSSGSHD
jgi:hypothetical protein